MNNIVSIYHIRDAYDHSLGYHVHNTYTDIHEETIKEIIDKQARYMKGNDLGGYWVQVITYTVGGAYTIVDHIKTVPQKTRIELNVRAKGGKRKSIDEAMKALNQNLIVNNGMAAFAAPPVVAAYDWVNDGVEIQLEEEENN
jgi:hypothetical protein